MADLTAKKSNFVSRWRQSIETILDNLAALKEMQDEATFMDYGTTLTDADLVGDNNHLTKAELIASFQTLTALVLWLRANSNAHYANLYKIKR